MNNKKQIQRSTNIIVLVFIILSAFIAKGENVESGLKQIQSIPLQSFEKRLRVIDSLETSGTIISGVANTERCVVYFAMNKKRIAMECGEKALMDKKFILNETNPIFIKEKMNLYDYMSKSYLDLSYNNKAILSAIKCLETAKLIKDRVYIATQYLMVGIVYYQCGDKNEFTKYARLAIKELKNLSDGKSMVNLSYIYGMYVSYLVKDYNHTDALYYCKEREKLIDKLSKLPELDAMKLSELDRQRGYLYCKMAYVLSMLGQAKEAASCYTKFYSTKFSKEPNQELEIVHYLLTINENEKIIDKVGAILPLYGKDTISLNYATCLDNLHKAYIGKKDYKTALNYRNRNITIIDSLNNRKNIALTSEIGEIYESSRKDALINKQESQLMIFIFITIVGVLLLIGGVIYIYRIRVYNKRLYKISILRSKEMALNRNKYKTIEPENMSADSQNNIRMYDRLMDEILTQKLFLSPNFGRKEMCALLATNENYLYKIFNECAGNSVANVLNNLRLDYSIELITQSQQSIEQIALNCGFNSVRTFQRLFKSRFGLTPTSFVKQHKAAQAE